MVKGVNLRKQRGGKYIFPLISWLVISQREIIGNLMRGLRIGLECV